MVELLTAYLDDALDQPARQRMDEHLTCCAECGRHLDQFRAVVGVLGTLPEERLRDDVHDRLISAFRARRRR
ncbi:zf-HC2 domain-containing protein [Planomonospora sp. ID67723]|uniref:anti-sigma factor family protein n=1 Tax=Planomonospora sp. ID67723 TaxID=2738134 RepID=UPI0027DC0670|nr:zf-HC2 domain-containing protein [Planomonospora sp. ID67723]